jgi:hypothetical protein
MKRVTQEREIFLDPNAPENFLARVKRVSAGWQRPWDALIMRSHHYQLEQSIREHMDGYLTDEFLVRQMRRAEQGLDAERMERPRQQRVTWADLA